MVTEIGQILLKVVTIVLLAKAAGWLFDKMKQPPVLGEILVGMLLGPSLVGLIAPDNERILHFLAEIGAILLLFLVGLESNLYQMLKTGLDATLVAIAGVVIPMALGFLFFYFTGHSILISIFIGATLTATSVGVTARVLADMGKVKTNEGKVVIGAAVVDDVLGLIILAVVVGIAATGTFSLFQVAKTTVISLVFLVGSIFIGIKFLPFLNKVANKLDTRRTYVVSAFSFAVLLGLAALSVGLATIVGAFAAGLILERTENKHHYEQKIKPVADLFVPIFFIMAGASMDIRLLFKLQTLIITILVLIIALISKVVAGLAVIKTKVSRLIVGIGMIPRGEVGLIFASYGLSNAIFSTQIYSELVVVIMLTTLIAPPLLSLTKKRFTEETA